MIMLYVVGAFFVIAPLTMFLYQLYIMANGVEVDAIVIRFEETCGRSSRNLAVRSIYHAIFSYTVDGKDYETKSLYGLSISTYIEGSIVRIIYHKNYPKKIVEKSTALLVANMFFLIFVVIGLVMIIFGISQ